MPVNRTEYTAHEPRPFFVADEAARRARLSVYLRWVFHHCHGFRPFGQQKSRHARAVRLGYQLGFLGIGSAEPFGHTSSCKQTGGYERNAVQGVVLIFFRDVGWFQLDNLPRFK